MLKTADGRLVVVSGASRSGKTAWTVRQVLRAPRAIAWDPEGQWCALPGWRKVNTRADLKDAVCRPGAARLAYVPNAADLKGDFDFWSASVFFWGTHFGPCVAVAEELADVTSPAKAPGHWGLLLRRGLKRGITVYAISQRWAEADKTAFGNASEFVFFRLPSNDDVRYVASKTRIPAEELSGLKQLEFVRYDPDSGVRHRQKLTFSTKKQRPA